MFKLTIIDTVGVTFLFSSGKDKSFYRSTIYGSEIVLCVLYHKNRLVNNKNWEKTLHIRVIFLLYIKSSYPVIISGRYCEDTRTKSYSFIDGYSVRRLQEHRRVLVPCNTNVNNRLSNLVPVCRIISLHSQLWRNRSSSKLQFNNCTHKS